jgi:imidazolonepropionase-like amidohydrolase
MSAIRRALWGNLDEVRKRQKAALFECQTRAEIQAALRLISEFKLLGSIVQPKRVDDMIDEIRDARVGVVIGPIRTSDSDKHRSSLVELGRAGVPLAFGGGDASELRMTVAWLVNGGMPRAAARRALVARPADRFGLQAECGRLSSGGAADLVIWESDPIDPAVRPHAVIAHGQRIARGS